MLSASCKTVLLNAVHLSVLNCSIMSNDVVVQAVIAAMRRRITPTNWHTSAKLKLVYMRRTASKYIL